jgi:hypothetical protein
MEQNQIGMSQSVSIHWPHGMSQSSKHTEEHLSLSSRHPWSSWETGYERVWERPRDKDSAATKGFLCLGLHLTPLSY